MSKFMSSLLLLLIASPIFAKDAKPNILWLFSDDHAFQAIGAYGGRFESLDLTPNIDRIAKDGMVFDKAYVGNSICAPSRATLLTGKHSHLNGKIDNRGPFNHDQQQFQKILQKNGYQTAMIGKIHLSGKMQGFDYWEVLPGQGKYWDPSFVTEEGKTVYKGEHSTDVITKRALNWLDNDRKADKPFMLMVHYKAPHRAWQPTTRWKEKFSDKIFPEPDTLFDDYKGRGEAANKQDMTIDITMRMKQDVKAEQPERQKELAQLDPSDKKGLIRLKYQWYMRDYLACIAGVDENIGFLLDHLKATGLDKNTIVMYSADQGFYLGEHGWFDKRFMYEESFRTPLLAKWPGVTKAGTRNSDLVQNIDFAETFLDIAGIEAPEDMQGESLVPLLKGETPVNWRKHLYYHYYEYPGGSHSVRRHEGVSGKRFKLIRFYGIDVPNGEEWEFYDLKNDPQEMKSQYNNPEYAAEIAISKKELQRLKDQYKVVDVPQKSPKKKSKKKK
ncbi:sulfatase [Lentisphaera profundi]|uniref:Sulfatase n=1 Tax=Lentisphaera profundi TaxID=1658616 RepID=A0ABY7VZZ2_9BACT|nr:sulfatase [Lentisphaera profundi]WDE99277.1 sulfatase [Lentisphaera profundi]